MVTRLFASQENRGSGEEYFSLPQKSAFPFCQLDRWQKTLDAIRDILHHLVLFVAGLDLIEDVHDKASRMK